MFRNITFRMATILVGLACLPPVVLGQSYDLSWYSIDGGGAMFAAGGSFELAGTIGQADAGRLTGGGFELVGGFWAGATGGSPTPCMGDLNNDRRVDISDLSISLAHFGTPSGATLGDGDLDGDGDVDLSDLTSLLAQFGTICD